MEYTTAQAIGAFRRELVDEGLPLELVDRLTHEAATRLLDDGMVVFETVGKSPLVS